MTFKIERKPQVFTTLPASAIKALRKIGISDDQTKVLSEHRRTSKLNRTLLRVYFCLVINSKFF